MRLSDGLFFIAFLLISGATSAQVAIAPTESGSASAEAVSSSNAMEAESWNAHGQFTLVTQRHGVFASPYAGTNSLRAQEDPKETIDGTLFLGFKVGNAGELYLNPEVDQGFGLSDTTGIAGFASGAAYKVGRDTPYGRLQRAFLRKTIPIDNEFSMVESGPDALAGPKAGRNLTLTVGKFSVVDIFDNNAYAHDPRADFMNWTVIDSGAFDYAADAWGYTYGMAVEWIGHDWTIRGGIFAMSAAPNSEAIDKTFAQREWVGELERRFQWHGHPGAIRLLGFLNQADMARYNEAVALALASGLPADVNGIRRRASKSGFAINAEQELARDLGVFARFSRNSGNTEAFDFTDINESLSAGLSLKGSYWNQPTHTFGSAIAINGLSADAQSYFAAGGTGILLGDGQLPRYSREQILEAYYAVNLNKALSIAGDFQHIRNPAYNPDRGPVSIWGLRVHAEF